MLAVVLVVLVIYVFLRNVPATIIPSLSVPLSLIGTFAVMYLANFSLNNLSLMALTIATGFVVDDAIVMIENISRYIETGRAAARGRAQGRRTDRLHHHIADRFADRRAHSAAVHAGRGRPPVPRIRGDAGRHDPDLRRGVPDAGADDVRQAAQAPAAGRARGRPTRGGGSPCMVEWYGRTADLGARPSAADAVCRDGDGGADGDSLHADSQGLLSRSGHRIDSGRLRGDRVDLLRRHGRPPAGARGGHPQGSGCAQPVFFHRRRRQQRHAEQRTLPDQLEAARPALSERRRCHPPAASRNRRHRRASRCTCSPCRI